MTMRVRAVGVCGRALAAGAMFVICAGPAAAQQDQPGNPLNLSSAVTAAASTAAADAPAAGAAPAPAAAQDDAAKDSATMNFFRSTEISGFVDMYYGYNFNTPKTPCGSAGLVEIFTCLHNFDVKHNTFSLNLAEVALERKPTTDSRGGFRVDLNYGPTASIVHFNEPTIIYENIQQAYVSYLAPTGNGLQLDFGKFVTPMGYEVIETKDNANYSRSLLFALAIPYYHMGMRAAYSFNDKFSLTGYLVNGWNNAEDNNSGKTVGMAASFKLTPELTITETYLGGPERAVDDNWRHTSDTIISWAASPKATLALNYDYGHDNVLGDEATWQGTALYLKYQASDWFAVSPRYEYYNDKDGFTTGVSQKVQEFTLTAELKARGGVIMRAEYRGDYSDTPYFIKNTSDSSKNQNVFTIGFIYAFSTKAQ